MITKELQLHVFQNESALINTFKMTIVFNVNFRMSKRKYDLDTLQQAVSTVKQGRLTVSKAAEEFGVPRKTVDNHVKGVYK